MTDNVTLPGTGEKVAVDTVAGEKYQKVKLDLGALGSSAPVVGTLPVSGTVSVAEPVTIDGDVGISSIPSNTIEITTHTFLTGVGETWEPTIDPKTDYVLFYVEASFTLDPYLSIDYVNLPDGGYTYSPQAHYLTFDSTLPVPQQRLEEPGVYYVPVEGRVLSIGISSSGTTEDVRVTMVQKQGAPPFLLGRVSIAGLDVSSGSLPVELSSGLEITDITLAQAGSLTYFNNNTYDAYYDISITSTGVKGLIVYLNTEPEGGVFGGDGVGIAAIDISGTSVNIELPLVDILGVAARRAFKAGAYFVPVTPNVNTVRLSAYSTGVKLTALWQPVSQISWPSTKSGEDVSELLLRQLRDVAMSPPGYDAASNRQRSTVSLESGTVTTVTTVTGLTNVDGYQGKMMAFAEDMTAWELCMRARVS